MYQWGLASATVETCRAFGASFFIALIMTYDRSQKIVSYHHSADKSLSYSMCPGHSPANFTGTDMKSCVCSFLQPIYRDFF